MQCNNANESCVFICTLRESILETLSKPNSTMLGHNDLHHLLRPTICVFQALGLAPFSAQPRVGRLLLVYARLLCVAIFIVTVILVHPTLFASGDVNMNRWLDTSLVLTTMLAHQVTQLEVVCTAGRQQRVVRQLYAAVAYVASRPDHLAPIAVRRLALRQMGITWLPCLLTAAAMSGLFGAGEHNWRYFRWMMMSRVVIHVRFLQLTVYAEWLGAVMRTIAEALREAATRQAATAGAMATLEVCMELYAMLAALATDIGWCFGGSVVVILLTCLFLIVSLVYWVVVNLYALRNVQVAFCKMGGRMIVG